jgi:hypothetical protein
VVPPVAQDVAAGGGGPVAVDRPPALAQLDLEGGEATGGAGLATPTTATRLPARTCRRFLTTPAAATPAAGPSVWAAAGAATDNVSAPASMAARGIPDRKEAPFGSRANRST